MPSPKGPAIGVLSEETQIKEIKGIEKQLSELLKEQQQIKKVLSHILDELKKQNRDVTSTPSDVTLSTTSYFQGISSALSLKV
jgi:septal ring factor EnvC (AmiA/AmiB activator)